MMNGIEIILIILALGAGFVTGYFLANLLARQKRESARQQAEWILDEARREAERIKSEKLLEIQDERLKLRQTIEREYDAKRQELMRQDRTLREREKILSQRAEALERRSREIKQLERELKERSQFLDQQKSEIEVNRARLEKLIEETAGITREQALQYLKDELIERARRESQETIREIKERARLQAEREAREIIIQAIQRSAVEHSAESTVSVVNLPNDELKGRIIGREGRNIRAFEESTGVDLIIDDTPGAVTLSCFDPIRREVARITLQKLIEDGRIHPARIEEMVKKAQKELEERIPKLGEEAAMEAGVTGLHLDLLKHLGKLHFRTSYGQNVLRHSVEVARLAALMAAELKLDSQLAARAGLLHDIGKAIDRVADGTHTQLGVELVKKYREPRDVQEAVAFHHESIEATSIIACLVQAADAISGSRPGARRDTLENYIRRLEALEEIAQGFDGVAKCYAVQAGREIRILVQPEKISDLDSQKLAEEIAQKIQNQLEYPGQIKVTVIREYRAVTYAK
ncbi:MAG: ribonuclease Y [bacterium]